MIRSSTASPQPPAGVDIPADKDVQPGLLVFASLGFDNINSEVRKIRQAHPCSPYLVIESKLNPRFEAGPTGKKISQHDILVLRAHGGSDCIGETNPERACRLVADAAVMGFKLPSPNELPSRVMITSCNTAKKPVSKGQLCAAKNLCSALAGKNPAKSLCEGVPGFMQW